MARIFVYIAQGKGVPDDRAIELLAAAKKIDANAPITAIVPGSAPDLDLACSSLSSSYSEVWKIEHDSLSYPNAELVREALAKILPGNIILLLPHDPFGIDLAPGLSIKLNSPFVSDVLDIQTIGADSLQLVRQEFGGQVSCHVRCNISSGAVISIRPGAFKSQTCPSVAGVIVHKRVEGLVLRRRYIETIIAEAGDVDITKHSVLVSIGRGIQDKDNVVLAEELAEELGAAVSCSRPVVDAKWLEKSRQVGSSGKTVKPKVYLACGISGAFQHLAGIQGSPLLIAINKNSKAPIFQVADVGVVDDVLEFLPALTEKARELHSVAVK